MGEIVDQDKERTGARVPIRLTITDVEDLQPESRDYFNPVEGFQGLQVRVLPNGERSFVLRYRIDGIQRKFVLGRFPAMTPAGAKKAHAAAWVKINDRKDPGQAKAEARKAAQEARKAAITVAVFAARYLTDHVQTDPRNRQGLEAARLINKHILPEIGKLVMTAVGPAEISALLFKLRSTPVQANRIKGVLRTMFRRAEEWGIRTVGSNPVSVIKTREVEVPRDRRLSDMELWALGIALRQSKEPSELLLAVRLAVLAGMRKGEIANLRWEWVDLEAEEITIPKEFHKTGKKTGKPRKVYLCSSLAAYLKAATPTLGCPFVVPGKPRADKNGKPLPWEPFVGLQAPWERIRDAAGLAPRDKKTGEYLNEENNPGWHDLRRTFSGVATDLGLKWFAGDLLGHAEETVTDIYTRAAAETLHDAVEKIGVRIEGVLSGRINPEAEAKERREAKAQKANGTGA